MTWRAVFDKGVACFKRGDLEEALNSMNQAAELEGSNFIVYDSRAAVHEKLGNIKAALLDSKRVIDLAPDRWQGYARSARLFSLLGKYGPTIRMADHALSHLRSEDVQRRAQLVELREKAVAAQATVEEQRLSRTAQTSYLLGKLPVETLVEIFTVLIEEDHTWAVKLSHVCGHWRRILISTPSAWRTLVLSKRHPLRKAKLWKERAKNRITHISVDVSELDRASVFAQLQNLFWDDLSSLRISGKAFIELHHMLPDVSLPHMFSKLDELVLFDYKSPERLSRYLSGPNWKLKILRLSGVIHGLDDWWQRVQQLKELHLDGAVLHFSTLVFTTNPSLEKIVLNCLRLRQHPHLGSDDTATTATPTSMNNLKVIECRGVTDHSQFLRAISTPAITHLSMFVPVMTDESLLHIASYPSLVELHVGSCSLSPTTLPTLLSSLPHLKRLQINAIQAVVNEMFQFLTPKTVDSLHQLPCRSLEHVDVSQCSDLTTSSLYAFVKTRAQYASESIASAEKCAVVVSLKVDGCPNIEPEMLPWFRSQIAQFSCVYVTRKDLIKNRRRCP